MPASRLTVPQGATLIGLLQSPSALDPFVNAFGPSLQGQQWEWPTPADVPSPVWVPDLLGKSVSDAMGVLSSVGLGGVVSPVSCGSSEPADTVGYYGPRVVSAGGNVTLCLSNGVSP